MDKHIGDRDLIPAHNTNKQTTYIRDKTGEERNWNSGIQTKQIITWDFISQTKQNKQLANKVQINNSAHLRQMKEASQDQPLNNHQLNRDYETSLSAGIASLWSLVLWILLHLGQSSTSVSLTVLDWLEIPNWVDPSRIINPSPFDRQNLFQCNYEEKV